MSVFLVCIEKLLQRSKETGLFHVIDFGMSQTTNCVDCPICGRSFPAAFVNEHVNKCLNSQPAMAALEANEDGVFSDNKSSTGNASFSDKSPSTFGKRRSSSANSLVPDSAPKTNALNMLKRSSSNLAGKSNTNLPVKRLKSHQETTNSFKSPENKRAGNSTICTPGTKEHVSSQSSNSYFPDKKSKDNRKAQKSKSSKFTPLAERMRPKTLSEYVGQSQVLGNNSLLRTLLVANEIPSMILWGPPGCGKVLNNCVI